MSRPTVYILCADGDEDWAEQLAGPVRDAGYEVAHNGTVTVGESRIGEVVKAVTSGFPIILCLTVKAAGNTWVNQIADSARGGYSDCYFPVQMEREAYTDRLALERKVARYWDDPAGAIGEIIDGLKKRFPIVSVTTLEGRISRGAPEDGFLNQLTTIRDFDLDAVAGFRALLRKDYAVRYPPNLSPWEFLTEAGLWVDGRLTRT